MTNEEELTQDELEELHYSNLADKDQEEKLKETIDEEDEKIIPNGYVCGECPEWDDVNGCWADYTEYCGREFDINGEEINEFEDNEYD